MDQQEIVDVMREAERRGDMETAKKALIKLEDLADPSKLPERQSTLIEKAGEVAEGAESLLDAGRSIGSSIVAEPIAGLSGLVTAANPVVAAIASVFGKGSPEEVIDSVRDTITTPPKTEGGQAALEAVGDFVEPVTSALEGARKSAGDFVFDKTGSPALAAGAATAPDAALELLGIGAGKRLANAGTKIKNAPVEQKVDTELAVAAPSKETLKAESTRHFKEIDDLGVTINRDSFADLIKKSEVEMKGRGGSARVTPEAFAALDEMKETLNRLDAGDPIPLSELEELREIASVAADTPAQPKKQAVALSIVNRIDDFIESATPAQFNMPDGVSPSKIGAKYKQARAQWGQFRRSQMLDKAVIKAGDQASGFENGLRIQFRQILNSEKKLKFFKPDEIAAMKAVVNGTSGANLFKALGKVGIDFGGGNNALLAVITGMGTFGLTGDPLTALGIVGASSVAKKLATRLTAKNAEFAGQVIRAGNDGRKIAEAYVRFTPKKLRSADELSLMLLNKNVDLTKLDRFKMEAEAARLAFQRRSELTGALVAGTKNDQTTGESIAIPSPR